MPTPEDQDLTGTWTVLPSVREALGFQAYRATDDHKRRDAETIALEVPLRPGRVRAKDCQSLGGFLVGSLLGLAAVFGLGTPLPLLMGMVGGGLIDGLIVAWRMARGRHDQHRWEQNRLGTTRITMTDEGLVCRSYDGSMGDVAWADIVTIKVVVPYSGVPRLEWWSVAGDVTAVPLGPGIDVTTAFRALRRWSAPGIDLVRDEAEVAG